MSKLLFFDLALGLFLVLNSGLAQVPPLSQEAHQVSQVAPPPPAPVPPNASRITATVLNYSLWPPGSLKNTLPPVPPDQTLYSLRVEIHTSGPENPGFPSLARLGMVIEAFSSDLLARGLVDKKIEATLKLTGDTSGVRWWISNVRTLP